MKLIQSCTENYRYRKQRGGYTNTWQDARTSMGSMQINTARSLSVIPESDKIKASRMITELLGESQRIQPYGNSAYALQFSNRPFIIIPKTDSTLL